jgi:hypothetical protein
MGACNYIFDIDNDNFYDFEIYDVSYFGGFHLYNRLPIHDDLNLIMNNGSLATLVAPGSTIGPDTTGWLNNVSLDSFLGTRGYAGVVFEIPGGSPHFAYLDISAAADRSILTLHGGAYESEPNTPIHVAVPEPGSFALLASGAAGLAAWRRKRTNTTPSSSR